MSDRPTPNAPASRKTGRSIPPLVWIIIAALLAGFIIARLHAARTLQAAHGDAPPAAPAQQQR